MQKLTLDNMWFLASLLVTGVFLTEVAQAQGIPTDWQTAKNDCQQQAQWQICSWPEQQQFGVHSNSEALALQQDSVLESEVLVSLYQSHSDFQVNLYANQAGAASFGIQPKTPVAIDSEQNLVAEMLEYQPGAAMIAVAMRLAD